MASATSSRARRSIEPAANLQAALGTALAQQPVPLLVLRLPEFERIAWRDGKRAARSLERKTVAAFNESVAPMLRRGDRCGHDPGSDVFAIAMSASTRGSRAVSPVGIRAVLERVAAAIALRCRLRVETGWVILARSGAPIDLQREFAIALERGARERERYEFFSVIAHELRTPLTSIRGYLETLLDEEPDGRTARRFLETARAEALRMGRLLDGMFEFSLLDLSSTALAGQSCRLDRQAVRACEVVALAARGRGIAVQRAVLRATVVALDADACLQLLVNLLENAVKYGREGGCVRISVQRQGSHAVVSVDDDGAGIAPSERESIFALRVRGSTSGSRPGTGIGLAIVKLIAERAGGCVQVLDSPLGGARFEAVLPLRQEKEESAACAS